MEKLSLDQMEKIQGGKYNCVKMIGGFVSAFSATFLGPVGIGVGAAAFGYGVSRAADCASEGGIGKMFS